MNASHDQPPDEGNQLFGADTLPGIVAVERAGDRDVRLYRRTANGISESREEFPPWLVITPAALDEMRALHYDADVLGGGSELSLRLRFDSWSRMLEASRSLRDTGQRFIVFPSATDQYLIDRGRGCFRGMRFDQLQRAQLDIETLGLNPADDDARLIVITVSLNGQSPVVFRGDELSEAEMLAALAAWIHQHDPDVIEGHNLYNFDIPFLHERARRSGTALLWGRDGSPLRLGTEQRFKVGARTIPFQSAYVYGRHLIDTYQQIQRYDTGGQLDSYALKPAIEQLGLARTDRTHVAGQDIAWAWEHDRDALIRYAIDDVIDVNTLSALALPTEFYQARILPRGLQAVATGGPGEKINDLLVRAYVAAGESVPLPSPPRDYPGGYAEVRRVGRFSPVVKCDVESLYPSIMLAENIAPASDRLRVFLPMLSILTERRLNAKRAEAGADGRDRGQWRGIQSSFKVLINSFYGYLGYARGYFNDYDAAERVTLRGQSIVQQIVDELERRGAETIEVDTDGVFFQPPRAIQSEAEELALINDVSARLERGIRLAHDGRFQGMLSLRLKNYALLTYDGRVLLKGSSLRSRREELFLRRFVRDAVARLLEPERHGSMRDLYLDLAEQILTGQLGPHEISRTETITDQTFRSEANRRLAAAVRAERVGERVHVYQRADGRLARAEEYADDEDRAYLLRRLRDMAERFRPLFADDAEFEYTFPGITLRTDVTALRRSAPTTQLALFPD